MMALMRSCIDSYGLDKLGGREFKSCRGHIQLKLMHFIELLEENNPTIAFKCFFSCKNRIEKFWVSHHEFVLSVYRVRGTLVSLK